MDMRKGNPTKRKAGKRINSCRKGKVGERELAEELERLSGIPARRTAQHCGQSGDAADVVWLSGVHIEAKRPARISVEKYLDQAKRDSAGTDRIPVVAMRADRGEWMALLPLPEFVRLVVSGNGVVGKDETPRLRVEIVPTA